MPYIPTVHTCHYFEKAEVELRHCQWSVCLLPPFTSPALSGAVVGGNSFLHLLGYRWVSSPSSFCSSNLSGNFCNEILGLNTPLFWNTESSFYFPDWIPSKTLNTQHFSPFCTVAQYFHSLSQMFIKWPLCSYVRSWGQIKQMCPYLYGV